MTDVASVNLASVSLASMRHSVASPSCCGISADSALFPKFNMTSVRSEVFDHHEYIWFISTQNTNFIYTYNIDITS